VKPLVCGAMLLDMETSMQQCAGCGVQLRLPVVTETSIFKCPKCGERIRVEGRVESDGDRKLRLREKGERIVKVHCGWAAAAGLVPVPLLDIAAVTGIQLDMLKQLCTLYKVRYSESQGKSWITSLSGSILARMGASALKSVPVIGSLIGGVSMAALSGGATYAVGQVTIAQFESGDDFETADVERAREAYAEEFERGKEVAAQMAKKGAVSGDVFEKLEKLAALKQKGIVSEAEYEAQKKKLLDQV